MILVIDIKSLAISSLDNIKENTHIVKHTPIKRLIRMHTAMDLDILEDQKYDFLKITEINAQDYDDVVEFVTSRLQELYWKNRSENAFKRLTKLMENK